MKNAFRIHEHFWKSELYFQTKNISERFNKWTQFSTKLKRKILEKTSPNDQCQRATMPVVLARRSGSPRGQTRLAVDHQPLQQQVYQPPNVASMERQQSWFKSSWLSPMGIFKRQTWRPKSCHRGCCAWRFTRTVQACDGPLYSVLRVKKCIERNGGHLEHVIWFSFLLFYGSFIDELILTRI